MIELILSFLLICYKNNHQKYSWPRQVEIQIMIQPKHA